MNDLYSDYDISAPKSIPIFSTTFNLVIRSWTLKMKEIKDLIFATRFEILRGFPVAQLVRFWVNATIIT